MPRRISPQTRGPQRTPVLRALGWQTTLDNLKKEAKRWLKALRENDAQARSRLLRANPKAPAQPVLRDMQYALAREHGFENWTELKKAVIDLAGNAEVQKHESLAADMVNAYATGDEQAIVRLRKHYKSVFQWGDLRAQVWRAMYKVRQASGSAEAFQLPEAQELMARRAGFPNWTAYMRAVAKGAPPPGPPYVINRTEGHLRPRRQLEAQDWEVVLGAMRESKTAILDAGGQMTDDVLAQIAQMEHVTKLNLSGSRALTDEGLQLLARMPQLQSLDASGTNITDRGLEVLRHLPSLRELKLTWQKGISDLGLANLKFCDNIEEINVMGTATGDGLIEALRGKPNLHHVNTGTQVTDRGAGMLRDLPRFQSWAGGACEYELMGMGKEPTWLLLDGPFTDAGLESVSELAGLSGLNLFWNVKNVTADGVGQLARMPNLQHFRCFDELGDDAVLAQLGRMPHLRMLMIQGTIATDAGFETLSKSQTIEYIWGRDCPNMTGRGFAALSKMPALRGLGVSCKNVDDDSLAPLPNFPALREFMPMDVPDAGFRHIGRCEQLERLWCMYCRDTGDTATEHVANLRLKTYYAGLTQITDRSLEILGRMESLEVIELYETKQITDVGLAHIAKLPRLLRVDMNGLPNVTYDGFQLFPKSVQVNWDV